MKKIIKSLMAGLLSVSLAACGGNDNAGAASGGSKAPAASEQSGEEPFTMEKPEGTLPTFQKDATIEETVLVDEQGVKITAKSLNYSGWAPTLTVEFENNTEKDLSFVTGSMGYAYNSVNGYMLNGMFTNTEVSAGSTGSAELTIDTGALEVYGIYEIADIELAFKVKDDSFDYYFLTGPRSIKTSAADGYDYTTDTYEESINNPLLQYKYGFRMDRFTTDELYNQNGVRIASEALITNKDGEQSLALELENTSDNNTVFKVGDITMNGLTVYPKDNWGLSYLAPHKKAVLTLGFDELLDSAYADLLGIKDIGPLSFDAYLMDENGDDIAPVQKLDVQISEKDGSYKEDGQVILDENNIQAIFMGGQMDEDGDTYHLITLVRNNTDKKIICNVKDESLTVNSMNKAFSFYGQSAGPGETVICDMKIPADVLLGSAIKTPEDITQASWTFEFKDDHYNVTAEPTVTAEFK